MSKRIYQFLLGSFLPEWDCVLDGSKASARGSTATENANAKAIANANANRMQMRMQSTKPEGAKQPRMRERSD